MTNQALMVVAKFVYNILQLRDTLTGEILNRKYIAEKFIKLGMQRIVRNEIFRKDNHLKCFTFSSMLSHISNQIR